jgi:flagellar hook-associated protein 1 FlgK
VAAARALADGIRERAESVARARAEADARIRDGAAQATSLAQQIADANSALATADDPVIRDRRDVAAQDLAALVGGDGRIDPDGQMRWVLPDGGVLVDGTHAATVAATSDPVTGFATIELVDGNHRRDVTASLDAGAIGGELAFRDVDGAKTAGDLDQLAFDLTKSINAVHQGGAGLDGVAGRDLFTAQATVAGAASRMSVDAAVAADSGKLATAAPGTGTGNNQTVLGLLALRDAKVAAGGTATLGDAAISLSSQLGQATAQARTDTVRDGDLAGHLAGLRDSLSGVDLDEELAKMVHFQHAGEAMTRFLSTVDGMLGDLLQRL